MSTKFSVDDAVEGSNLNQVLYVGTWGHCKSCDEGGTAIYYSTTQSWCNEEACQAQISFEGTQVVFRGVTGPHHGIAGVSIDSGTETMVDLYSTLKTGDVAVWTSPQLSSGLHTIKIRWTGTYNSLNTQKDSVITLDRIEVVPKSDTPQPVTQAPPIGAIIGGVVGGIALLALVIGGFLYWKKKMNQSMAKSETGLSAVDGGEDGKQKAIPLEPPAPPPPKLSVKASEIVINRDKKLGEAALDVVYEGTFRGSFVAIKTLKVNLDKQATQAFVREMSLIEPLSHRNVIPLAAYCSSPPMLVTKLAHHGNLRDYLTPLNWNQYVGKKVLIDVAAGMAYLHSQNILHGELKSLNILVDLDRESQTDVALISDYGLHRVREQVGKTQGATSVQMSGAPAFSAPETLEGRPLDKPADVYGFAMLCYEVVSKGAMPFQDARDLGQVGYFVAIGKVCESNS